MADGDRVEIDAVLNDAISAATARIEQRLKSLEDQFGDLGRAARVTGRETASGLGDAEDAAEDLGRAARRARPPVRALGDEAVKTGAKARAGSAGLDTFARHADRAGKSSKGSGAMILTAFKFSGIITGAFALAGGLSAIGAGGAIAVGGIAPVVGVLAGVAPLLLAAKLGMLAFKLSAEAVEQPLTRIKNQFTQFGDQIADAGLRDGLDYLADSLRDLSRITGNGLAGLGAEIGDAARATGDWAKSEKFLGQVETIFTALRPILGSLVRGVLSLGQAMLNLIMAALPMAQQMADLFAVTAQGLADWTARTLENGTATAWLNKSWSLFLRVMGVLADVVVGVYRTLKIAAGYSMEMGLGIEDAARHFRNWTGTAEGQARINQYFQDSLPALREMGKLLGLVVGGLAKLGTSTDVAPLLSQIRTEFAPALGDLVTKLSGQGGLGPALISAATALAQLTAGLDLSGLTVFMEAIAALANAVNWIVQNVPGANFLISALLMSMLGFKLLGPVFSMIGGGAKAFSWLYGALQGTKNLTKAQQMFKGVAWLVSPAISRIGTAFKLVSTIGIGALRALSVALVTTPIGWVILAIVAVIAIIYLLWTHCEWFRDAVTAVWDWIQKAAVAAWEWIKEAFFTSITAINDAAQAVADFVVGVWHWIADTATTIWTAISDAFKATIDFIASVANWLYSNVIEPVFSAIADSVEFYFGIIKFIVQTAIFIIVAIISLIAIVAKAVWDDISSRAKWTFDNVIVPVVEFFRDAFVAVVDFIVSMWNDFVTGLGLAWQVFYDTYIKPVIEGFSAAWTVVTSYISTKWNEFTTAMGIAWRLFYDTYIAPIIQGFQEKWNAFTGFLGEAWSAITAGFEERWNLFKDVVGGVISTISDAWGSFTQFLSDVFSPVGDMLTGVWQKIQDGATAAAKIVSGAWDGLVGIIKGVWNTIARGWNGIPSITVPDFVPGIGGKTFSLPKLPTLWHGGEAPGGKALVGEHGPEPLVRNGQFAGMVGTNGPEVANIPRGGYVVPNLNTLAALPGLTKSLPAGVAAAVARSVPGYAGALKAPSGGGDGGLRRSVDALASAVAGQMPPVHLHGTSEELLGKVIAAWKAFDNERKARGRYTYTAGKG